MTERGRETTKDVLDFLSALTAQGIQIWQEDGQLRVSAPKGMVTPALQGQIVARKAAILSFLSEAQPIEGHLDAITPSPRAGTIPLSASQQEIWPMIQRNPGSGAYQVVFARRSKSNIDLAIMKKSLAEVVQRHEILRTIFPLQDGRPVQVIRSPETVFLEYRDLRCIPQEQRENDLRDRLIPDVTRPLDPGIGPLFRFLVCQMDDSDFVLMQVLHFLVADCVGQAILDGELTRCYSAYAAGQPAHLPHLPLQYADYARWQQEQTRKGNYRDQLDFWRKTLAPPLPARIVLAGQRLDAARSSRAERRSMILPAQLTTSLQALARRGSSTLYMVLLAAFGVFLSGHSHQSELLIGSPVAGRIYPGLENVVGRFLNTMVMRLDLSGEPSFLALLERVRQTVLNAFSNQDVPFVQVTEALQQAYAGAGARLPEPLFSVQLNFAPLSDDLSPEESKAPDDGPDLDQTDARYPLTLYIRRCGESLQLKFIAQEGLFTIAQLDAFLEQIQVLLESVAADPEQLIGAYFSGTEIVGRPVLQKHSDGRFAGATAQPELVRLDSPHGAGIPAALPERGRAVEKILIDIWKRLLKIDQVSPESDFFALGGSSLLAMQMVHDVNATFDVNIPLHLVFRYPRIHAIAAFLQKQTGKKVWDSLVEIQPNGDRQPIYFVHGITGDTLWFEQFAKYLKPTQPVYGLQARGLDGLQTPQETIEEMARLYIQEIRQRQPNGPYAIAGYSFGGHVAYEMACQLRESGQEVGLLLVVDQANPRSDFYTVRLGPALIVNILRNLPYRVLDLFRLSPRRMIKRIGIKLKHSFLNIHWAIHKASAERRPLRLIELADYAPSLPVHIQNIIKQSYAAQMKYIPRPYPGKLTLIRAQGGRLLCSHDPLMGWGSLVNTVDVRIIPGAHVGMFLEPHIRDLSAMIQTVLDESQAGR